MTTCPALAAKINGVHPNHRRGREFHDNDIHHLHVTRPLMIFITLLVLVLDVRGVREEELDEFIVPALSSQCESGVMVTVCLSVHRDGGSDGATPRGGIQHLTTSETWIYTCVYM